MLTRKLLDRLLLVLILTSLVLSGSVPALGQEPGQASGSKKEIKQWYKQKMKKEKVKKEKRITPADRQAAAERAAAGGFTLEAMLAAAPALPGETPRYFSHPNYANSPLPAVTGHCSVTTATACSAYTDCPAGESCVVDAVSGGIRKFVDGLPGLNAPNNLQQQIPVAVPDITTYPNSDYYEIGVVQFRERMHSDLPGEFGTGTLHRGYVQLKTCGAGTVPLSNEMLDGTSVPTGYCGATAPHFLGPAIVATKDRPVRLLFRNLLPTGLGGNLFIPTDATVMGAGMGPSLGGMIEDTAGQVDPMCGQIDPATGQKPVGCFTENRATLHLHGGISPWISDGTPHQWITPDGERGYPDAAAGENKGVSVAYVPDMWFNGAGQTVTACAGQLACTGASNYPGEGAQTYYWTNQQSARLMFYHDHAWGITRLNVYAGEAAAYVITDDTEQALVGAGRIPGPADTIPLVIQDRTFVPSPEQIAWQDSTWDYNRWGGEGNLWLPHVYSPAQNPGDASGVNEFGRWAYGPWFWPPTQNILYPPLVNTFYDPNCNPATQWCEPEMMPGTPFNSMGMEAFHDTPIVNGTAYPTITLEPKAYRLRILNAANDRFFNLSLYRAVDAMGNPCDGTTTPVAESTGVACTEVALNPAELAAALEAPPDIFPLPLDGAEGPAWIQIGTEGGFLPAPAVIPPQYTTWVVDPALFIAGLVDKHSLLLGPAERADTIVDFSGFAGQTLILYNDAPAAFPARDPRYDLYTGNADLRDTGGPPPTLPGYGPNTRTVMQIKVEGTPAPAFNLGNLEAAFAHQPDGSGVFESGQHPIIVGQAAYNSAYGTSFDLAAGDPDGFARITDFSMTFDTLSGQQMIDFPFQPKAIQDEMGEAFDHEYGRMSGNLGLEVPLTGAGVKQNLILYPYSNPASELIDATNLPWALNPDDPGDLTWEVQPFSQANDGTQIWKITHNGVDTHPIHFHLYDVQLLNRVGWDGMILPPDDNELGWKDTVRISPLEDTIVALRPVRPVLPWDLPNSVRLLNPAMPEGSTVAFNSTDENANPTPPITNQMTNFGWEYVWHCHILSHEEMDMMRPQMVAEPPPPVTDLAGMWVNDKGTKGNRLTWTDPSIHETGFEVWRGLSANRADGTWGVMPLATVGADVLEYIDTSAKKATDVYFYQVFAINTVGFTGVPGYKNLTAKSVGSNIVGMPGGVTATVPAAPTNLTALVETGPQVRLDWTDNANNETSFVIQRAVGAGAFSVLASVGANTTTYTDLTVVPGNNYSYRVAAANAGGQSPYSNTASVAVNPVSTGPSGLVAAIQAGPKVRLDWTDNSTNETSFLIHRDDNGGGFFFLASVGPNITTFTDLTVAPGNTYTYHVAAVSSAGQSAWSNDATADVLVPADPSTLTATLQAGPQVLLDWTDNATNEDSFVIQRSDNGGAFGTLATLGANVTTYTDTTVVVGNTYDYQVAAVNVVGSSNYAGPANVVVTGAPPVPADPSGLGTTVQAGPQVLLNWTDNANNEDSFVIERDSGVGFSVLTSVGANVTTYTDTSVAAGGSYNYRVAAVNLGGQSGWSNMANAVVPAPPGGPAAPSNVTAQRSNRRVWIRWTDNANDETGFVIQRANDAGFTVNVVPYNVPANDTRYRTPGKLSNGVYYFRIQAVNGSGASAWVTSTPPSITID